MSCRLATRARDQRPVHRTSRSAGPLDAELASTTQRSIRSAQRYPCRPAERLEGGIVAELSRLPGPIMDLWEWQYQGACRQTGDEQFFRPEGERGARSEEHTSELQSRGHLVCRLLLEKKKNRHIDD